MALFPCLQGGGGGSSIPDELIITTNCRAGSHAYLHLTQSEVDVLTAMGYNFVTTSRSPKTAISTNEIEIAYSQGSSAADGVITFSKT
jgi:hypothetical protein